MRKCLEMILLRFREAGLEVTTKEMPWLHLLFEMLGFSALMLDLAELVQLC